MKLGDAVKKVTESVGIPQCEECKKRQQFLNEFGDKIAELVKSAKK